MSSNQEDPPVEATCSDCGESLHEGTEHVCKDPLRQTALETTLSAVGAATTLPEAGIVRVGKGDSTTGLIGQTIGERYEIQKILGQGGMGVVFRARHIKLEKLLAVKLLITPQNEEYQRRFLQEAQLASRINHPNTVFLSDYGVLPDGRPYIVMEFLRGPTLSSEIDKGPLDPLRVCQIGAQIARGLQSVHDSGIIHRDLKPDNVFLVEQDGRKDVVKIVDFGIAKQTNADNEASAQAAREATSKLSKRRLSSETLPGTLMGTPAYMAPEMCLGLGVDVTVDQYALGAMLYEMITGRLPFEADTLGAMLRAHIEFPPPPLREKLPTLKVAESLEETILRLLSKAREDRFPSMAAVAEALEREADAILVRRGQKGVLSRQLLGSLRLRVFGRLLPLWAVAASLVVVLAGGAAVGWFLLRTPPLSPEELEAIRGRALAVVEGDAAITAAPELRQRAVRALGQTRDVRLRPDLERLLTDAQPEVQSEAATSLGLLADRQAVPALSRALATEKAPSTRAALAGALLTLGDSAGATELAQLLTNKDDRVRLQAAKLLCDGGQASAQPAVRDLLGRPGLPPSLQVDLLACLVRLGDEASLRGLRARLTTPGPRDVQLVAASKLAQLGDTEGRAYLLRLALLRGADQLTAAWLLSDPSEPKLAEVFRTALENRNAPEPQRVLGAEGLGQAGELLEVRRLDRYLASSVPKGVRQAAAAAILVLARGGDANLLRDQSLAWAAGAAGDSSAEARQAAAAVLGESASEQALGLLSKLLHDRDPEVRKAAARALGRRGDAAAVAALTEALSDPDAGVRQEALRSLGAIFARLGSRGTQLSTPVLLTRLNELAAKGSDVEKVLAASVLLRLGNEGMRAELRKLGKSTDPSVRKLVLEALDTDRDYLAGALADPDQGVRLLAARLLAALGDKRGVAVLQEALARGGPDGLAAYALLRRLGIDVPLPADLDQLLTSGKKAQRLAAVAALRSASPEVAGPLLLRAARDPEAEVRRMVAEVAGELLLGQKGEKDPTLLAVLRLLGGDRDAQVWTRARALLSRVLGALGAGKAVQLEPEPAPTVGQPEPAVPRKEPGGVTVPPQKLPPPPPESFAPEPPPSASGKLVVEGPQGVQFLLKRGWHPVPSTLELPFGEYEIDTLAGEHEVVVTAGSEVKLTVEESAEEKALRAGVSAARKGGLVGTARSRAVGQLERARNGCLKSSFRDAPPCQSIILEASYYVGKLREEEGAEGQAMDAFQQVVGLADRVKGLGELKSGAQTAVSRLRPRLGHVVEKAAVGGKCVTHEYWVTPGKTSYQSVVLKKEITVSVSAGRTVPLNFCEGSP